MTRILKIGDQRLAREIGLLRLKIQKITPQRLRDISLSRGNIACIFATPEMAHRDRTGWLGWEDSNFGIRRRSGGVNQASTLRCCTTEARLQKRLDFRCKQSVSVVG
jgi:hypothetical protein